VSTAEPSVNDLSPVVTPGVEKEPVALIDTSGSMSWPVADGSTVRRMDVVGEAMGILVKSLEDEDSQAAAEQAGGDDEKGGLLVHLFSDHATELGDLNSANWREKWGSIHWGGGTRIMSAWKAAEDDYLEEFGDTPALDRPVLLTLVVTDGEAQDGDEFTKVLQQAGPSRKFCVAVVGFGPDHDATLAAYKAVEAQNGKHVRVVTFGGETDPAAIAADLITLLG
jgi:ABC-type sugar transport system substrate-binding protein